MNKNAIQKYAIWARNELIEQIKQRAYQYGISDKGYGDENATVIAGRVLSADEKRQRAAFVSEIKRHGFEQAVEDVAYTWFNRFVALRFMEVNDYLPTHVRVFSDASGGFNPEILKDVLHLELEGLEKLKVSELLNANKTEELYRYLLLTQCNALNVALPEMFEKLGGYTEMLLPNNILKQDSVLARLVKDIDEEDWKDAVQIIGWMYQYYNTEPKDTLINARSKYNMPDIPFVTQLFTSDWIVRFMVDNSLGRLWLESHPNSTLKANWKYYLDEAEQTPEVAERLRDMRSQSPVESPEDIRIIDPCMGSGHILAYAFDVLMQIYVSEGYNPRDAAKLILEKNIYGLDIDRRAYQLAYFSLMMKARQYNRRIFNEEIKPQVYHPAGFPDGEEYGSLVKVEALPPKPLEKTGQLSLEDTNYVLQLNAWNFKRLLAQKYDVVTTNPPYLNASYMPDRLKSFINENYADYKSDLFSAYFQQVKHLCKPNGHIGLLSPYVWMFISSHEKSRSLVVKESTLTSLVQLEYNAFEAACIPVAAFTMINTNISGLTGEFIRLSDFKGIDVQEPKTLEAVKNRNCGYRYTVSAENFEKIPGYPVAYWIATHVYMSFSKKSIENCGTFSYGVFTCNNSLFLRKWHEVNMCKINFMGVPSQAVPWCVLNKGGTGRRWYGNLEYVIYYGLNGGTIRNYRRESGQSESLPGESQYFKSHISWSLVTNARLTFRYYPVGMIFDISAPSLFCDDEQRLLSTLALLNSKIGGFYLSLLNPTMNNTNSDIKRIPYMLKHEHIVAASEIAKQSIAISRTDWDAFETSWDFKRHKLVVSTSERNKHLSFGVHSKEQYKAVSVLSEIFKRWDVECNDRFSQLKSNEEELNRLFIEIYGLHDELTPDVEDKDITVRRADLGREVRSLISYAVGCMFGRYSLDTEGLAYAGGNWDAGKYRSFIPDKDNILPICDDEYFDDDILGRFVDFVQVVYGAETLEENLKFIADALGGKGTSREIIRNYFLNDFYKDHCKIYQKRPIYWLFDSGKKNGFKSLVYLHRYQSDLLTKLRTDYVHEQQERYRTQLSHISAALNTATGSERARLLKQQNKLSEQLKEITAFEEKVHHLADQNIEIDLDDGVKKNYEIFTDVLAKI